jgi:hypothetical protein
MNVWVPSRLKGKRVTGCSLSKARWYSESWMKDRVRIPSCHDGARHPPFCIQQRKGRLSPHARPSTSGQSIEVDYIHCMKRRMWCKPTRRRMCCLPTQCLRVMAAGGSLWKMRCGRESGRLAPETTTCTCNLSLAKHSTIRDRVESSAAKLAVSTRCIEYCYWTVTMEDPLVFANRPCDASGSWEAIGRQRNAGPRSKTCDRLRNRLYIILDPRQYRA